MFEMFGKVLPVILLFFMGYQVKRSQFISAEAMGGVKKIVIYLSLPAVLFRTFMTMDFKMEYLALSLSVIVMLTLMFGAGLLLNKIVFLKHKLNPYLATGFSFGLLGIPLFAIVFGEENLGVFSVLGLGHEIFVWFIYYTILHMEMGGEKFSAKRFVGFFKSPVILSIFIGLFFNITGFSRIFYDNNLFVGVYSTLEYLARIATPLILLTIGYSMKISHSYLGKTIKLMLVRIIAVFGVGYLFKFLVIDQFIEPSELMNYAFFTFLVLPPLFSLPLFVGEYDNEDEELSSNVVVTYTTLSMIVFVLFAIFFV